MGIGVKAFEYNVNFRIPGQKNGKEKIHKTALQRAVSVATVARRAFATGIFSLVFFCLV